jgi:nucleoside-diphosphate-sugar epimerase
VNFSSRNLHELVIIYGANGFLGSVIIKRLHKSGIPLLAVIRPYSDKSRLEGLKNLEVVEEESFNWPQLIEKYKPGAVICAQWRGVSKSDREDSEIQESNIQPLIDLAHAALASSVQTFICFGSQAESQKSIQKIPEETCSSGTTAYGRVKAELHSSLESIFNESKCRFVWARVFSVYGPSDTSDSLLMQLHESESQAIKLEIENPRTLWSFLYEDDFAAAVERILQSTDIEGIINIGNPLLVEIQFVVDAWFESSLKPYIRVENTNASEGFFPDLRKLKSTGWTSGVSLEEGIQRTRKAYREHFNSN